MRDRRLLVIVPLLLILGILGATAYRLARPWVLVFMKDASLSNMAEQGDPSQQRLYAESLYEKHDYESALKWELRSANGGDALAQNFMGHYFRYGINDRLKPSLPDYATARTWYEKAAAQDFQPSQLELCDMYATGIGVSQDNEASYFWCILSDSSERASKLRQLSGDALDVETRQRVEQKAAAWIEAHRKSQ